MFSETRYALNGDLRVAYRVSPEGPRDLVFHPELVDVRRDPDGVTVASRVGEGDGTDLAKNALDHYFDRCQPAVSSI